jgi:endonuclease/exonuclease/phosphatase (EEP) superfamily protein YafD
MASNEHRASNSVQPHQRRWTSTTIAALAWAYLGTIVAVWLFLRLEGDRWWVGMVAIFAPRWIAAVPLMLLIPLASAFCRRSLWVLAVGTILAIFPVMGFCLPLRRLIQGDKPAPSIRVLTCNVHGGELDPSRLTDLILSVHPDIIFLQEWFPRDQLPLLGIRGWNSIVSGELCAATRFPIHRDGNFPSYFAAHYAIETSAGTIDAFNVHLSSPHYALRNVALGLPRGEGDIQRNSRDRENEARQLNGIIHSIQGPLLIAGDFNLPPDSAIFRDNFSTLTDSFAAAGFGFGWTYHSHWTATRIDHILSNSQWVCRRCWVGPDVGSLHRPLIADLTIRRFD